MRGLQRWGWGVVVLLSMGCGSRADEGKDEGSGATDREGGGPGDGDGPETAPPPVKPALLPNGGRQTEFAVNLVDAELREALIEYLSQPTDEAAEDLSPEEQKDLKLPSTVFLEHFKDEYDFLFFIMEEELDVGINGLHGAVSRETMPGTGLLGNLREGYGTAGKLKSAIGLANRDEATYRPPFAHEVMHHWAQHLDESLGFGDDFKGGEGAHWGTSSVDGILGGFDGASLRCKTPTDALPPGCSAEESGRIHYVVDAFSPLRSPTLNDVDPLAPLELFLMGLIPGDQIPQSYTILEDAAPEPIERDPSSGKLTVDASGIRTVTVDEIIALHGRPRILTEDERRFRGALVVVSDAPVGEAFLNLANDWAASFHGASESEQWPSFATMTGGRAEMDMRIGEPRADDDPPDFPDRPAPMCDVLEQDCGEGFSCYDFSSSVCLPPGPGAIGDPCLWPYDCGLGLDCSVTGTGALACSPYCDIEEPDSPVACDALCPGAYAQAYETVLENGELTPALVGASCFGGAGTGACDPLNQSECPEGYGCFGREATTCQPEGSLELGEECYPIGVVCEAGSVCIGILGQQSYCQPYCDPDGDGAQACSTLCPGGSWPYGDYSICIPD